MSNSSKSVL